MITEDYVSFETAKLLNNKGFKGEFHKHYWGYEPGKEFLTEGSFNSEYDYPAPTLQMAMKWLREVHHLHINIEFNPYSKTTLISEDKRVYWLYIYKTIFDTPDNSLIHAQPFAMRTFKTYEEACEAGIKCCLENFL